MRGRPGINTRPKARLADIFPSMVAWMTSPLNVALLRRSLMCLANFLTCYPWVHGYQAPANKTSVTAWLYKHPWVTCQKIKPNISMTRRWRIKATFSVEVIRASMTRKGGGNWACGRVLCPGCSRIYCRI